MVRLVIWDAIAPIMTSLMNPQLVPNLCNNDSGLYRYGMCDSQSAKQRPKFFAIFFICPRFIQQLNHFLQQEVDLVFPVAVVSTIDEVVVLFLPAAVGGVEFEVPEEVVGLLEVGSHSEDLVDQILHADDAVLAWKHTKHMHET